MDYVYQRAHFTIGLFQARFSQRQLHALSSLYEHYHGSHLPRRGPKPSSQRQSINFRALVEAAQVVANDRWNTRAWIIQEAFVSQEYILLFPRSKGIKTSGWCLVCHDLSFTDIAIDLRNMKACLDLAIKYFRSRYSASQTSENLELQKVLSQLRWFQPQVRPSHSFIPWINDQKPRRTCNAAVALSYLKVRDNHRVADRLAIIANMCDYNLRLNTARLEEVQPRLSLCIHAIAIANGDLSLLMPENYRIRRGLSAGKSRCQTNGESILLTAISKSIKLDRVLAGLTRNSSHCSILKQTHPIHQGQIWVETLPTASF